MDSDVILSHRTAWVLHQVLSVPAKLSQGISELPKPEGQGGILLSPSKRLARIRAFLEGLVPEPADLDVIEILVSSVSDRIHTNGVRCHVLGRTIDTRDVIELIPGISVVSPSLCLIHAATWMDPLDHLEWGHELCGRYRLRLNGDGYDECPPRCDIALIRETLDRYPGVPGAGKTRRALTRIRDNSRSPMETALALAITLPPRLGGLGILDIRLNHPVPIPRELKPLITSEHLEVDIYCPHAEAGAEYDGGDHADLARRTRDADRLRALQALDIPINVITAGHFTSQLAFRRALTGLSRLFGKQPHHDLPFQRAQNHLRHRLIRHWHQTS